MLLQERYPAFVFEYTTDHYTVGTESKLQAGIATIESNGNPEYERLTRTTENVFIISVSDDNGAERVRILSASDLFSLRSDSLRQTRDTHNNCDLCFSKVSHYSCSSNNFTFCEQLRTFEDSKDPISGPIFKIQHCESCQSALETAINEICTNIPEQIVSQQI